MDRNEARLLLQACRPNNADAETPAFAEALAMTGRDPELKAWWESQQAFDQKISAKLQEIPAPAHLRATILSQGSVKKVMPRRSPTWLAIAAVVMVLCLGGGLVRHYIRTNERYLSSAHFDDQALAFLGNDSPALGTTSTDHEKLIAWLKERNSPVGTIPSAMGPMPSVGCQTFAVKGHRASLICFTLADGGLVHLFVIDQNDLADPPSSNAPEFKQSGNWSTASWSDGVKSYMLATQAGPEALKHLL